ncbi:MAG: WbqC family protein [Alphaproteobacteria bacterium]|nr:WbqC family protein [Alphaproteobacteria bacterium]
MQPYFLPYIGYWQLMAAVDCFVIYDTIKYTKRGWINRNRTLKNGAPELFTLPLQAAPDTAMVVEREIAADFRPLSLLQALRQSYRRAPHWAEVEPLIAEIILYPERNLFAYIHHSVAMIRQFLGMANQMVIASTIDCDHGLRSQARVIEICRALGATEYLNNLSGASLYDATLFRSHGLKLSFFTAETPAYPQDSLEFQSHLSIIDLLAHVSKDRIGTEYLTRFQISSD